MSAQIKDTPDYGSPAAVLATVALMQTPERIRASNRALVDSLMNGRRPYTDKEVAEHQIQVNVNWGEGSKILQDAQRQVNNALLHKGNFVTCTALAGKVEKREEWGAKFTANLNRVLKRGKSGKRYLFTLKSRNASLVMHGIGALMWPNNYDWLPRVVPLEDLLMPTETLQDFSNLTNFAVNLYLTPYELMTMTHEDTKQSEAAGWNLKAVRKILSTYGKLNVNDNQWNWWDRPEEMVTVWKENAVVCNNDSVPKVNLVCFYYRSPEGGAENKEQWYRKICLKNVASTEGVDKLEINDEFIFDSGKKEFADSIDKILAVQFGDCNLTVPQTYHATRGLGEALYAVIECMNRLRCQWMQHVFENLLMLIRVQNPSEQDRPKIFNLKPYGVIEDGVSIIPQNERHQIDPRLVESAMSENRQLMSENSSSFVQEVDNGTGKEQTLGEAQIRLQTANKMVSSMLDMMYLLEGFCYEEIVRRFLIPTSQDPDVKRFQAKCKADGIPDDLMKPECWQVDADRVMGGGDQALAQQEATALFTAKGSFDPSAQRIIDRNWVRVMTRNPAMAELLVPDKPETVTPGTLAADETFPNLMLGVPADIRQGIERQQYVTKMIEKMGLVVTRINNTDQVGTQADVIGLSMVSDNIKKNIELMEQNPANKQFTTGAMKAVGKLDNEIKAFTQRQQEAKPEEQDPEAMLKLQNDQMAAQQKLQNNQKSFDQKMAQSEAKFSQKIQQQQETQAVSIQQMLDDARVEIEAMRAKTIAEIKAYQAKTQTEIDGMKEKAAAQPATAATE